MDIYLDLVILLNFAVDLLLLWAANRLSGHSPGGSRTILAASFGGVYAGMCLLPGFWFLSRSIWRVFSLLGMSCIAFGWKKNAIRKGLIFLFLSMALGGMVVLLGRGGFFSVLLSALILCGLCILGFRGHVSQVEYVSVDMIHRGKTVCMTALRDTGNTLRDPVTGCPVLVADARMASGLLGLQEEELCHPIETISQGKYPGLRLIPYCAVGQPAGMLLGLRVDSIRINGKPSNQIVAFAPHRIGQGSDYEALTGGLL